MEILMEPALLNYLVYNNDLISTCDVNSRFTDQGPGIYEVLRIQEGKPLFLDEHIRRFFNSARYENFPVQLTEQQIRNRIKTLIESNGAKQGNIRFQLTMHPEKGPVFMAWVIPFYYPSKKEIENGVAIKTIRSTRDKPQSKRTNLPVRQMVEQMISEEDIAEVLMITDNGLVTEGSRSNIFFVKASGIYTPPLELVLPGITRSMIIRLASSNGVSVYEKKIGMDDMAGFDACFLSSTSKNILPVRQIDNNHFTASNPVTQKLIRLFDDLILNYLVHFSW